jgi:hypothetical protein
MSCEFDAFRDAGFAKGSFEAGEEASLLETAGIGLRTFTIVPSGFLTLTILNAGGAPVAFVDVSVVAVFVEAPGSPSAGFGSGGTGEAILQANEGLPRDGIHDAMKKSLKKRFCGEKIQPRNGQKQIK